MEFTTEKVMNFIENKMTRQDIDIDNKLVNIYDTISDNLYCLIKNSHWFKELIENYIIDNAECYVDDIIYLAEEYYNYNADDEEIENEGINYFIQIGLYNCDKLYIEAIEELLDVRI